MPGQTAVGRAAGGDERLHAGVGAAGVVGAACPGLFQQAEFGAGGGQVAGHVADVEERMPPSTSTGSPPTTKVFQSLLARLEQVVEEAEASQLRSPALTSDRRL
ncbi:hypothetical protein [Streptomyces sp. NPDC006551]|uniref:hypothetical protein n=1 Tax=Streptomyces sp. NPDC006551 TaxID=3157178 RepID=UPI0033B3332D